MNKTAELYRQKLMALSEPGYRAFSEKLNPGVDNMLGVRLPKVRALARELAGSGWQDYFSGCEYAYFEEVMLRGLTLGYIREPTEQVIFQIREFLPMVDNWSVCDSSCAGLKSKVRREGRLYWELVRELCGETETFRLRWGVVMLMDCFIDEEHIDRALSLLNEARPDTYYAQMAVAWALSECFVRFPKKTMILLKDNALDDFTYNKAIQKIRESLRVDEETRARLKTMKRQG